MAKHRGEAPIKEFLESGGSPRLPYCVIGAKVRWGEVNGTHSDMFKSRRPKHMGSLLKASGGRIFHYRRSRVHRAADVPESVMNKVESLVRKHSSEDIRFIRED